MGIPALRHCDRARYLISSCPYVCSTWRPERQLPNRVTNRAVTRKGFRGYKRAPCGHGGLYLRRMLRADGAQSREGGSKRQRIGISHLPVCSVRPQSDVHRQQWRQLTLESSLNAKLCEFYLYISDG